MSTDRTRPDGRQVVLRDGSRAELRPILPEDKDTLRRGFEELSPRSRYLRFHTNLPELTPGQLAYLTEVDHEDHEAWVAFDLDDPQTPGMGVARYVRLADEPTVAEAAVTVVDAYQRRGLGTVLLQVLADEARRHGIEVFRSYVLADNDAMLEMLQALGGEVTGRDARVVQVDLEIGDSDAVDDSAVRRVLRAVAARVIPGLSRVVPPLWRAAEDNDRRTTRSADDRHGEPGSRELGSWLDAALDAEER
ncbi:MAG: GNAT family N-acetyltransferase [Actinobacteria bacterium]|nr:GNAT family N-acetyltransferase [Actinomycetota bacterium]